MGRASLVVVFALAASRFAAAQDGGVPIVCGALDDEGACFGETAAWCSGPNDDGQGAALDTRAFDCASHDATCVEVGGVGAWCVAPLGSPCALDGETRVAQLGCGALQLDLALGCDLEEGCRAASVPCPPAGATSCAGDTLVLSCAAFGQPLVVRCTGVCSEGRCLDQGEGSLCDAERLSCAEGLTCSAGARCVVPVVDEPSAEEPDRRAPFESGGCKCVASSSTGLGAAWPLVGVFLATCRGRRRPPTPGA